MSIVATLLLACGLAVDSCVVALAQGIASTEHRTRRALLVGAVFGLFQGLLAWLGWLAGDPIARAFSKADHWVAFAVLGALGTKSILDGVRARANGRSNSFGTRWLMLAAFATSIDALAAGFGLALAHEPIARTAIAVTTITAVGSSASFLAGRRLGLAHRRSAQCIAGVVLIGIGVHILYTHMSA